MANIRIERVPIQEFGLWRIRADHLMLVYQQDPLDYGEFQDRWWVMEGTRDTNPDGSVTVGVDGANGVTTLSQANGGLTGQELLDAIQYPWWRGSRIISSTDSLSDWGVMSAIAREIDTQGYPYFAFNLEASPLPIANSSSVVATLLFYIGLDIAQNMPFTFLSFTVGTRTLFGTSDDDRLTLAYSFNTLLSGDGNDTVEGTQNVSQVEKFYGGRGNDVFLWTKGSHVYHGGEPGLDYENDGYDSVDYTGVGTMTIEGVEDAVPHLRPQFVVTHATGIDRLFSIDEIRWDDRTDTIIVGEGVELDGIRPFLDMKGQSEQSRGDTLDFSSRTTSLMVAPSDRPDIVFVGSEMAGGSDFSDGGGWWARSLERLIGSTSDDRIYAGASMTVAEGGTGNDLVSGQFAAAFSGASQLGYDVELSGDKGDDTLVSGSGRSIAFGGEGADQFVLSAVANSGGRVEFVIADADASDRFFIPYNFLVPGGGTFEGSELFPVLGAVTPVIGAANFTTLPQSSGSNGAGTAGYFSLIGQVALDGSGSGPWSGVVDITDQILFTRDGGDLLIHIYSGSEAFDPMFLTLLDQDFTYRTYDSEVATEAVVRVVGFEEGMLGIKFYELGDELPFPFPSGSGTPDPAKLWNTTQFAQAGGTLLSPALEAPPETVVFDRPIDGETDTRDLIAGGEGDDILIAGAATRLTGFSSGADLSGFGGNDILTGGNGRDVLDGGSGNDTMSGGSGNDRYVVDSSGDRVIEASNEGIDIVVSSIGYALPDHVEYLTLTGGARFGQGNAGSNRLLGSSGDDRLIGLGGEDTIVGGTGNDLLDGGAGDDTYVYYAGDGTDTLLASTDASTRDILRFVGIAPSDVQVFQSTISGGIVLRLADGGRVMLDNFFSGGSIDAVGFDDGTAWTSAFLTVTALQSSVLLNDAPIAGADDGFFSYAKDVLIPASELLANDRDLDGDALTIVAAASATAGATLSVTPTGDVRILVAPGFTGLVAFTYTVADGRGGQTTAAANVTIVANEAPILSGAPLVNQAVNAGQAFAYTVPLDTFSDPDGHPLIYTADLQNGSPLPSWLSFNAATRTLTGVPPADFNGDLAIRVTASDSIAATSTSFVLSVSGVTPGLTLVGTAGNDVLTGGAGNDTITGGRGNDILNGLGGDDLFLVSGNAGFDNYDGGAGRDVIRGSTGDDIIGLSGTSGLLNGIEAIDGGAGFDTLRLDGAANVLDLTSIAVTGIEQISGGAGDDRITGSAGNDVISGNGGNDLLAGGLGNDTFQFTGNQGRDRFDGGSGFDRIVGSTGNDVLFFDRGSSDLVSIEAIDLGAGLDILRLGSGSNSLDLSAVTVSGLERIEAGGGNDVIIGSRGGEVLAGGAGQDLFVFRGTFGHDTIEDFQLTIGRRNGDVIDLSGLGFSSFADVLAHTRQVGANSVVSTPDADSSITILNVASSLLQPNDFQV